jgi:glycolate oxidase
VNAEFAAALRECVGADALLTDPASLIAYGTDALQIGRSADFVAIPADTAEVAAIARLCNQHRVPMVVRGAGTGYTGGAVPVRGGVVISMERFSRILEIDEENLLVVTQPHVITRELQDAVEARGLFYPPDPASLKQCSIGGNVAESAGGPRAVKYGTTKRYVLALEAVLPTGEVIRTGSKCVKSVVGYDLTQLLVGSEGTLAILTEITLRLVPKPAVQATLQASFADVTAATRAVSLLLAARVVPATIELIDSESLAAVERHVKRRLAPDGTRAMMIVEVDGLPGGIDEEATRVLRACEDAGALHVTRAETAGERDAIWSARRELSYALRALAPKKINHDIVVPRGRVPQLFDLVARLRDRYNLLIPSFGHAGDGNIHVNLMIDPANADEAKRAKAAERELFEGVVALEGSITGEHGIGFSKAPYLGLELSADVIALSRRLKAAFDPNGLLNPGKMWDFDPATLPAPAPAVAAEDPE